MPKIVIMLNRNDKEKQEKPNVDLGKIKAKKMKQVDSSNEIKK